MNGRKCVSILLICALLLSLLSLAACGKKEEDKVPGGKAGYILTNCTPLPESVTGVTRLALDGDRLLLCCREESGNGLNTYAASLALDGTGFTRLPLDLAAGELLLDLVPDGAGGLWGLSAAPQEESASFTLRRYDAGGNRLRELLLDPILDEKQARSASVSGFTAYYPQYLLAMDGAGNLCLCTRVSGKTACFLFDGEGRFLFSLEDEGTPIKALTKTASGQLVVCSSTDGDWTYAARPLDMEKQSLGEGMTLGTVTTLAGGAGETDLYLYDSSDFCSVDLETGEKKALFPWADLGLSSGDAHICPLADRRFAVVNGTGGQEGTLRYEFSLVEPGTDERTVLEMVSLQPDKALLEAVARFNKHNDEYKVELSSVFSSGEDPSQADWDAAVTQLNTQLISGDIPDLLDLNHLPADAYSRRGFLEDLHPWLERDVKLDDYFSNVFTALEIDGRLPYLTSGVKLYTVLADRDLVGDKQGWTVEDYAALLGEGRLVEGAQSDRGQIWYLMNMEMLDGRFVDWKNGVCRYDSEEFLHLMELYKAWFDALRQAGEEERQANCVSFVFLNFLSVSLDLAPLGLQAAPVGFPSSTGEPVHILEPENMIGFSAACEHKEGAWAFVRSFLEPELQEAGRNFPYLKSSFEKLASQAEAKGETWYGTGYVTVTAEQVDLIRQVLGAVNKCYNADYDLSVLVQEQVMAYLTGAKTAQEAAREIQSRATLYVGERMENG